MTAITYTAKRALMPGHSIDTVYIFDLPCQQMDLSGGPSKELQQSLSGRREALRFHRETFYDVTPRPLNGNALLQLIEFLQSCESEETFTWEPYGSVAVPGTTYSATLDGSQLSQQRFQPRGQGGANDNFVIPFRVRVLEP